MSVKIKKGDTVKVIAGKDKDKEGKVLSVDLKNNRVCLLYTSRLSAWMMRGSTDTSTGRSARVRERACGG